MAGLDKRDATDWLSAPAAGAASGQERRGPGAPAWSGRVAHPFDAPPGATVRDDAPRDRLPGVPAREPRATAVDVHVGTRLRQARLLRGQTQTALAETLGITFQQVQRYEQGTNRIGASRLFDIARALDIPIASFFDGVGPSARADSLSLGGAVATHGLPQLDPGSPERKETLDLIRTYDRILDPEVRQQVLSLVKTIAGGEAGGGARQRPGAGGTAGH